MASKKRKTKQTKRSGADGRSKRGKYEQWLTEDGLLRLGAWARDGLTQAEIAHNCGCSLSTLKEWMKKYPAISEALTRAREVADIIVENALFKSATGYTVELKKTFKLKRIEFDQTTGRKIAEKEYLETGVEEVHIPANEKAQEFWLRNRKPEVWRDKQPEAEKNDGANQVRVVIEGDDGGELSG